MYSLDWLLRKRLPSERPLPERLLFRLGFGRQYFGVRTHRHRIVGRRNHVLAGDIDHPQRDVNIIAAWGIRADHDALAPTLFSASLVFSGNSRMPVSFLAKISVGNSMPITR